MWFLVFTALSGGTKIISFLEINNFPYQTLVRAFRARFRLAWFTCGSNCHKCLRLFSYLWPISSNFLICVHTNGYFSFGESETRRKFSWSSFGRFPNVGDFFHFLFEFVRFPDIFPQIATNWMSIFFQIVSRQRESCSKVGYAHQKNARNFRNLRRDCEKNRPIWQARVKARRKIFDRFSLSCGQR